MQERDLYKLWTTVVDNKTLENGDSKATYKSDFSEQTVNALVDGVEEKNFNTGLSVDPFAAEKEIARGGMGVIHEGIQKSLNRKIAIKTILGKDPTKRQKFIAESMITAYLDHPNIIPVHELGYSENGDIMLAMKLVQGEEWTDLLQREFNDEHYLQRHLNILIDICNAVAFAHSKGIVHNDLKPSNVMVGACVTYAQLALRNDDLGLAEIQANHIENTKVRKKISLRIQEEKAKRISKEKNARIMRRALIAAMIIIIAGLCIGLWELNQANRISKAREQEAVQAQRKAEKATVVATNALREAAEEKDKAIVAEAKATNSANEFEKIARQIAVRLAEEEVILNNMQKLFMETVLEEMQIKLLILQNEKFISNFFVAYKQLERLGVINSATIETYRYFYGTIELCDKYIRENPGQSFPYILRGELYVSQKKYNKAELDFTKAINVNRSYLAAYKFRGNFYKNRGNYNKALKDFDQLQKIRRFSPTSHRLKGGVYAKQENYLQAEQEYNKALQLYPEDGLTFIGRANTYYKQKKHKQALSDFTKVIELNVPKAYFYFRRGLCHQELKLYKEAIKDYTQAIKINSNYGEAYFHRGFLYENQGKITKAKRDYKKIITLSIKNQDVKNRAKKRLRLLDH